MKDNQKKKEALDNILKKKYTRGLRRSRVVLILAGKRCYFRYHTIVRIKALARGFSVLEYIFDPKILSSNLKITRMCFEEARRIIRLDLNELEKDGMKTYNTFGYSMGGVHSLFIANNDPRAKNIVLVTPANSLAEAVWFGTGTKLIKKKIKENGLNLEDLKREWKDLELENNLYGLGGKEIFICVSKGDTVVPYAGGKRLIEAVKRRGLKLKVKEIGRLDHVPATALFLVLPPKILFK